MTNLKKCVAAVAVASVFAGVSHASVLTFDEIAPGTPATNGGDIADTYGDRIASTTTGGYTYIAGSEGFTPNVELDFLSPVPSTWTTGYSGLTNVLYEETDGLDLVFQLTADPGYLVELYSFDIGNFGGAVSFDFFAEDGNGNTLYSTNVSLPTSSSGQPVTLDFVSLLGGPLASETILFRFAVGVLGGASDNVGIDNIRFGQALALPTDPVPLPAAVWLMAIGAATIRGTALRKKKA